MTAQIRPNRMEVSDRYPMLGFAIRTDQPNVDAEVVLANEISLFDPANKQQRSASNFYSSAELGHLTIPRGEGIFVVPPEALARFIGNDKLYFGLATGHAGNGGLAVDALPREGSPYVSLRGFTGRSLRRSYSNRRTSPVFEWAGDAPKPGSQPAPASPATGAGTPPAKAPTLETAGSSNGQSVSHYDDGFGLIPNVPAKAASRTMAEDSGDALNDFPEGSVLVGPLVPARANPEVAQATAMVAGAEDFDTARRLAGNFSDLFTWTTPKAVVEQVNARGFSIQPIYAAAGDLNLDFYKVDITRFPDNWDAPRLLEQFIKDINQFVDTDKTDFAPYDDSDQQRLNSANKVGAALKLDIEGPDNAAIVISDHQQLQYGEFYVVTTIETPWSGSHPVSGYRQFGYYQTSDHWIFYTRGADRSTAPVPGTEWLIWRGADALWQSFQSKVADFINGNGGEASVRKPFSERFNATAVRLTYGNFDAPRSGAMSLGATSDRRARSQTRALGAGPSGRGEYDADNDAAIVPPNLPGLARERANRIGGMFAARIGEALDLGLPEAALNPLLEKLEPTRPLPMTPTSMGLQADPWSINWDDVELRPQPTDNGCWATTLSMLIGWRDQASVAPETIAQQCGKDIAVGLPWTERAATAVTLGLNAHPPQCYAPEGFAALIENYGPLYVGKMASSTNLSGHAVLVVGMYFDGADYFVRVTDPWDRPVGAPGSPGAYASTHSAGSRYIMRYADFQTEYEMAASGNPANVQIFSAGVPAGRQINRSAPPVGYAMAVPATENRNAKRLPKPPRARARALDIGAAATIAGTAIEVIAANSGDIHTNLARWPGIKHPNDRAPARSAPFNDGSVELRDWPLVGGTFGIDDIYCWLKIRWQYNGISLGQIYIEDIGHDDAVGWGLTVDAAIEDDSKLYPRSSQALVPGAAQVPALHVNINYSFDETIVSDQIANTRVTLYADGTYDVSSRWVQHSRPGGGTPTNVPRPFEFA